ncbi:UPF0505 protein C16orf62 homolog [Otolemur garnettii]|uniref:UPF0505 protein C16orf62 homolog n=1 Tax=Otolemur garnettii TaxID=30611 RepID=UPI000C7E9027|nr:UPF0505 protein C16orf62 homolog [Otolemur garnettii]
MAPAEVIAWALRSRACPSQSWRPGRGLGGGRGAAALGISGHVTGKMAVFPWHSRNRNYKAEFASCRLEAVPLEFGDYHPLKPITVTESKTKKVNRKGSTSSTSSSSSSSMVDPLSSVLDGTDPLSMFAASADPAALAAATDSSRKKRDKDDNSVVGADFEPWANKRGEILARYTTTEKLSINLFMGSEKVLQVVQDVWHQHFLLRTSGCFHTRRKTNESWCIRRSHGEGGSRREKEKGPGSFQQPVLVGIRMNTV